VLPRCNGATGNQAVAAAILLDLHCFMYLQLSKNRASQSSFASRKQHYGTGFCVQ
jgi:hypothetical protein